MERAVGANDYSPLCQEFHQSVQFVIGIEIKENPALFAFFFDLHLGPQASLRLSDSD